MNEKIIYPPCKQCGKSHGMGVEDMQSGEITPIDLCYDCLWSGLEFKSLQEQVKLSDSEVDNIQFFKDKLKFSEQEMLKGT